jgi:hypothetical protein
MAITVPPASRKRRSCGIVLHVVACQRGLDGRYLLRGDGPGVPAALVDRIPAHAVDVVEKVVAMLGRDVEHRAIRRQQVLDRLPEVPGLRLNRERVVVDRDRGPRHEGDVHRCRAAGDLRQDADLVVEAGRAPHTAVPPVLIAREGPVRGARLAIRQTISVRAWAFAVSVACRPASIQTTALPSEVVPCSTTETRSDSRSIVRQ